MSRSKTGPTSSDRFPIEVAAKFAVFFTAVEPLKRF
jgi:hypothetical protein